MSVWHLGSVCLTSVTYIGPKTRTERPTKTKIFTEVATSHVTQSPLSWLKGQRSRSSGLVTHHGVKASVAVSVRTYWRWLPTATLPSAGAVGSAAQGASASTAGGGGGVISWRSPAYSLLYVCWWKSEHIKK